MDRSLIVWLLVLGVGVPLLTLVLNEVIERLESKQAKLALALRKIVRYVLPPLAVLLVMQKLLNVASTEDSSRIVETLTWIGVLGAGVPLLNAIFTTAEKPDPGGLHIRVPNLFFQVLRTVVVLGVVFRVLGGIWNIDLSGLATAAGVGSLVIALALQDTLSNLVSGFLMLLSRPFEVGDYVEFDDVQGYVIDQNWRSVTLRNRGLGKDITVPNGTLAQATIDNFGNADQVGQWKYITCRFSYDDPPFKVLGLLSKLGAGLDDELLEPDVHPVIDSYDDVGINYNIWFKECPDDDDFGFQSSQNALFARLYYLAKREGLTIPYPVEVKLDASDGLPEELPKSDSDRHLEIASFLANVPSFAALDGEQLTRLARSSRIKHYGLGEIISQEGEADDELYLIYQGSAWSSTRDQQDQPRDLAQLKPGAMFGEMALFPGETSPITVVARDDIEAIALPCEAVRQLIQGDRGVASNPKFASNILLFIEERRKMLQPIKGQYDQNTGPTFTAPQNGMRRKPSGVI